MVSYNITDILNIWQAAGVFAYLIPFLIVFAVVYGILLKTKLLGENRGVIATIALGVGLMSLLNDYVSNFFSSLFPYAGMAIAVLLVALILMGLVVDQDFSWRIWFIVGIVGFVAVILASFNDMKWWLGGSALGDSWPAILAGLVLLALMYFIIWGGEKKPGKGKE
jgi:hypothetical protein